MYFVYVLHGMKDYGFCIGFADDLESRLKKHISGSVLSTQGRRPLKLIFYEAYINRNGARRREKYLKTMKGHTTLRTMLRDYLEYAK